ncbi:MAG: septum formation initiator family protein [PVC group bacterium]
MNRFLKIFWLILLIALFAGFGWLFSQKLSKLSELRRQQLDYGRKVMLLETEVARLNREIEEIRNNPDCLEKLAREKLGMAGKNEMIFIFESTPAPE